MVFAGELFLPEASGYIPQKKGFVYPGRPFTLNGDPLYEKYIKSYGYSRHLTIVFATFVLMQVFNMINARKINDEVVKCAGCCSNVMFIVIWLIIFVVQVVITQLSQDVFKCARGVSLLTPGS